MANALFVATLATVAFAVGFGWACSALARRWGVRASAGFTLGVTLGILGFAVLGVRARLKRRVAKQGEITW